MRRSSTTVLIACLFAALFAMLAHALAPMPVRQPSLRLAALPTGVETDIAALRANDRENELTPIAGTTFTIARGQSQWLCLTIDADWSAPVAPVLSIHDAAYTAIHLYAPPAYAPEDLAVARPDPQARFSRRALATVLPTPWRAGEPVWLRIDATRANKTLRFALTGLAAYQAEDLRHVRLSTLFASVQLAMILVGACLWLALRDRVFVYFVGYSIVQLAYQTLINGELYDWAGGRLLAPLGVHATWICAVVAAALAISFILEFCDLRRRSPRLGRALGAFRWPFLASVPLIAWGSEAADRLLPEILNLLLLLSSLLALAAVGRVAWHGSRAARFFVIAWMPQVAFTALRVGQLLLGSPQPAWIEYGFPFTMAFASIVLVLGLADDTLRMRREHDVARHLASHDGLTGALNRRALIARLADAVVHARERKATMALLFLDIDHFKAINDRYGHPVGDACLKAVADCIARELHPPQALGRYGGEEFLAVLPGASCEQAAAVGERLRRSIEALVVDADGFPLRLTVSIGVAATTPSGDQPEQLIERADRALYRAKSDGRNRVNVHPTPAAAGL